MTEYVEFMDSKDDFIVIRASSIVFFQAIEHKEGGHQLFVALDTGQNVDVSFEKNHANRFLRAYKKIKAALGIE
jgi:mevalonate pyrophosphate decarboxylase